jgi:hypothetical protein
MAESNPVTLPRKVIASKVRLSDPGFSREDGATITDSEQSFLNDSIKTLRAIDPILAIRALSRFNGVFSTAVASYIELGMSGYTISGYVAGTNDFDPVATAAAFSILAATDTLYDYTVGYGDKQSLDSLLETLLKEATQTGACSMELVLNRFRLPERMVSVPTTSLEPHSKKEGTKFFEQIPVGFTPGQSGNINLDIPTFFYASVHQQSNNVFARSPMEAALQTVFVFGEFLEDVYRILRKSGHSRMVVKILQAEAKKGAPPEAQNDPKAMQTYLEGIRTQIETILSGLEPEEALVMYDTAEVSVLGQKGEKSDYTGLMDAFSGMLATSLKSMPSTLGLRISGSQSLSNTESLVFLKMVRMIQRPVETVISRALTLSTRLLAGTDSYIKFKFNAVDIRPESELSAHRSVDTQNILRKLSLGFISDEEASHLLGTGPLPAGFIPLSGTRFMEANDATQPKDMNDTNGPQERALAEGTENGSATSNGGGNPEG